MVKIHRTDGIIPAPPLPCSKGLATNPNMSRSHQDKQSSAEDMSPLAAYKA